MIPSPEQFRIARAIKDGTMALTAAFYLLRHEDREGILREIATAEKACSEIRAALNQPTTHTNTNHL